MSRSTAVSRAPAAVLVLVGSANAQDAALGLRFASDSGPNGSSNWTFAGTAGTGSAPAGACLAAFGRWRSGDGVDVSAVHG